MQGIDLLHLHSHHECIDKMGLDGEIAPSLSIKVENGQKKMSVWDRLRY